MLSHILEELEKYDDNSVLTQFYEDIISRYANIKEMLQRQIPSAKILEETTWDQLLGTENPAYKEFYDNPSFQAQYRDTFFAEILDAKFLHNIYQLQIQQEQGNLIAVCAGPVHTANIERVLPKLGYEYIGGNKGSFSLKAMHSMVSINIKSSLASVFSDSSTSTLPSNKLQAKL